MASDMPKDWTVATLGNCGVWYSGGTPNTAVAEYWDGDIPWITASSLHEFYITDSERRVTELGIRNGTRLMPTNTILFVVRGMSLKTEFRVGIARCPMAFGQDCKAIIARPDIEPLFLANALRAKAYEILNLADEASHGTGRLQTDALTQLEIDIPPISEQRAIAHVLGTLDDKIELNRRMNETLEAMARALFKSWFVDFDPVRAKAEGHQPIGMDAETAALFPDSFEDSELGEMPNGWRVGKIANICAISRDTINPGASPTEVFDYYSIPAYDEGRLPQQEVGAKIKSNKFLIPASAVLLSRLNPDIPRIWLPTVGTSRRSISSTEFLACTPRDGWAREYLYCLFSSQPFLETFTGLVTGTSGSHQRVKYDYFPAMSTLIPREAIVSRFAEITQPMFERITRNLEESCTLAILRDALLPKLLSGEVRVKDAKKFMEQEL